MKTTFTFLFFIAVLFVGCEKTGIYFDATLTDGFCIVANDKVILNRKDIDYYDYSTHLIYLKADNSFNNGIDFVGTFTIYADRVQIYKGATLPPYSSYMPSGPVLMGHYLPLANYIVPIELTQRLDSLGNVLPDPREDVRIVNALKKYDQFHAGLSCEIKSVQYLAPNNVKVELVLKNNDSFNYYYLDPDKMGVGLFHYFTNGLSIRDFVGHKSYTHPISTVKPEPWNSWKKEWMSVINGNEHKTITITYTDFEVVPPGRYKATFNYPGLSYQVEKKDISQENGQIWLGYLYMIKEITIQ